MSLVEIEVKVDDNTAQGWASVLAMARAARSELEKGIRVNVDNIAALSSIEEVKTALNSLHDKTVEIKNKVEGGGSHGFGSAFGKLFSVAGGGIFGEIGAAFSSGGGLLSGLSAAAPAVLTLGTAFGTLVTLALPAVGLLTQIAAALIPIGIGFGGLAAIAVPEISKVWAAVSSGDKAIDKLSPAEQRVAHGVQGLQSEWGKLVKSMQPQIITGINDALGIMKGLFPALSPLIHAAGSAMDGFLHHIETWVQGPSGQKFVHWLQTDGVHAITTFGHAMWDGAQVVGRTFDFLYNAGHTWLHNFSNTLDVARETWVNVGHVLETAWDSVWHFADDALHTFLGNVEGIWHTLQGAWRSTVSFLINEGHTFVSNITGAWHTVVGAFDTAVGAIRSAWSAVYGAIVGPVEAAYHTVVGIVDAIRALFSASIAAEQAQANAANAATGRLPGVASRFAAGGISHAGYGGSPYGLTLVGEFGPELVDIPNGSRVFPAANTQGMLTEGSGGFGGGPGETLTLEWVGGDPDLINFLKKSIRVYYGGNVIRALGH